MQIHNLNVPAINNNKTNNVSTTINCKFALRTIQQQFHSSDVVVQMSCINSGNWKPHSSSCFWIDGYRCSSRSPANSGGLINFRLAKAQNDHQNHNRANFSDTKLKCCTNFLLNKFPCRIQWQIIETILKLIKSYVFNVPFLNRSFLHIYSPNTYNNIYKTYVRTQILSNQFRQ